MFDEDFMAHYHPCHSCKDESECDHKYNRKLCDRLQKQTMNITEDDKEMFMEQILIMCVNLSPQEASFLIWQVLYSKLAAGTADKIAKSLVKTFKTKEPRWLND